MATKNKKDTTRRLSLIHIFKPGIPLVTSATGKALAIIKDVCAEKKAPLMIAGVDFCWQEQDWNCLLYTSVEGIARGKIKKYVTEAPFFKVEVEQFEEEYEKDSAIEALMRSLVNQFEQYVKLSKRIPPETMVSVMNLEDPGRLADIGLSSFSAH